ncbi:MAG TPA: ROK family transcriptional regulator [Pseudonocardiaceae bacterium]|jgi:predicted NBD/HSP70 family sugar kinase|nr:ROK family transcriptional regulator [Pseudonocardiaceae bacterium]
MTVGDAAKTRLLAAILGAGEISRAQLSERTGLSASRVTKVVAPLLESGVIEEVGVAPGDGPGRPQRMLAVRRNRSAVIGIKLAPSRVTGVLTDMDSQVLARADGKVATSGPDAAIHAMRKICDELRGHPAAERMPTVGVGVGLGGHVDSQLGVCVRSGVLGWEDVAIADRLVAETGLPVVVNNDVNALAVAEHWFGKGRSVQSFAVVTTGLGVGCGLVLNDRLHVGASGLAGEFGHLPLFPDGPPCTCGNRGCLEAVASFQAIVRMLRDGGVRCRSIAQAVRLARKDDTTAGALARQAFATAGSALGRGIAALCNMLNLERIILSGEGVSAQDLFGPALDAAWRAHSFSTAASDCELIFDVVGQDMWARGAACLAIQNVVDSHVLLSSGNERTVGG